MNPIRPGQIVILIISRHTIKYVEKFTLVNKTNFTLILSTSLLIFTTSTFPLRLVVVELFQYHLIILGDDQEHPLAPWGQGPAAWGGKGSGSPHPEPPSLLPDLDFTSMQLE
jgi:hypothetical protein